MGEKELDTDYCEEKIISSYLSLLSCNYFGIVNVIKDMIRRPKNTKKAGILEFLVYGKGTHFIGVCLTFGIVEEGKDPKILMESIKEAAQLHLEVVVNKNLSDNLLNRYAPEEYWDKYFQVLNQARQSKQKQSSFFTRSPYYRQSTLTFA